MKHIPTTLLPALALLALGSCATTNGLTTTEPDGVYYSSKDRTTDLAAASTTTESSDYATTDDPNAVANPEYTDGKRVKGSASDEYYDDDYDYAYTRRRYSGLGMGYNNYWGYAADPYWYSPTPFYYGSGLVYSPYYGYGGGWYDPFWGPSWYGGGSFVSINIGWGRGGWGPWGPSYGYGFGGYRPFGYGYGGYYNGFYDGYYSGLYGNGWRNNYYGNWDGYRSGGRNVNYGHRNDRSVEVVGANGGGRAGRARVEEATGGRAAAEAAPSRYRSRVSDGTAPTGGGGYSSSPNGRITRMEDAAQPAADGAQPGRGRLYRITDANGAATPGTSSPQLNDQPAEYGGRRRPGRVTDFGNANQNAQPAQQQQEYSQPQPQRVRRERYTEYSAPAQQAEQPTRRERSYEAPTRSYEAPSRSYEAPSLSYNGGGNFGGGGGGRNGGGGGGGGGRGRVN